MKFLIALILALTFIGALNAQQRVSVAAASDLAYCLEEMNRVFHREHPGLEVIVSNGSSGMFFNQIRQGAPFDVYLSADIDFPNRLVREGEAVGDSLTLYALGRIVLWTNRTDLPLDTGLEVLRSPSVRYIALANPEHAPYGKAGKAALEHKKIWDEVKTKVVFGQNILQAMQFVDTGNADVGVIALSLVTAPAMQGRGRHVLLPHEWHPPLEQALVLTRHGSGNPAAQTYLRFLQSAPARAIFEKYGFVVPTGRQ
ncbi:MAG TPA: molybdate ABC transporter substrate-binding protein [Burkholderiales bacterium]|nr:molybdate ABC transporter substrate-binding protein [Burkholderiales bacterium]